MGSSGVLMEKIDVSGEIQFKTARSGGKGGQNVNKVETMVEGYFHIEESARLTNPQKLLLVNKLSNRINKEGFLLVKSQEARTQLANRQLVTQKINELVNKALIIPKKRIATKTPKGVKEKRLNDKKVKSDIKAGRGRVRW
jgi:ribosome-associated protein